jgi:SagB-type dehydrogenase family enzyme
VKVDVTVPTDRALREVGESRLFEIYHTNTKLTSSGALQAAWLSEPPSSLERYLTTRGFRQYRRAESLPLPPALESQAPLQEILVRRRSERDFGLPIEFAELGTVLEQALGCTATVEDPDAELIHALRAWPSAGGLYPIDTYIAARDVAELESALYHYNPIRNSLERLPSRDVREIMRDGYFDQDFANVAAAALFLVACFSRTVAKYGERGYRLALLDAGHAAQNILLSATQLGIAAIAIAGYCDDSLAADIGIDGVSEAVVHSVLLGRSPHV